MIARLRLRGQTVADNVTSDSDLIDRDDCSRGRIAAVPMDDDESLPICPVPATRARLASLKREGGGLVRQCDVLGLLHCHSVYHGGAHTLREMVETSREIGLEYLGFSDHMKSEEHPDGLEPHEFVRQRAEIEELRGQYPDFDILHGVEVGLDGDGSMPMEEEILAGFDFVIVSLGVDRHASSEVLTGQVIRAIMHPCTTILSKPVGEYMLTQPPVPIDMDKVLRAAAEARIAVELNALPERIDTNWIHCRLAQQHGVLLSINPNAHRAARLVDYRHGVELTRKAGICCRQLLNTLTAAELRAFLKRDR